MNARAIWLLAPAFQVSYADRAPMLHRLTRALSIACAACWLLPGHVSAASPATTQWSDSAWSQWDGEGQLTAPPAVLADSQSQRLTVVGRGADQAVWYRIFQGGSWGPWLGAGGVSAAAPAVAPLGGGQVSLFVRGADGQLWTADLDASSVSAWQPLGGLLASGPAVASWAAGRLDVVVRGSDRQLWHRWRDASGWHQWEPLGGILGSGASIVSPGPNLLDVFARGADGQLWQRVWTGAGWLAWQPLGGALLSAPAAVSSGTGSVDVFVRGTDQGLWTRHWDGTQWSPWKPLGGRLSSEPSAAVNPGGYDVFVRGTDAAVWRLSSSTGQWSLLDLTPRTNVVGDVAFHGQAYALSCEAAALQMALSHEGLSVTQAQLLNGMGIDARAGFYSGGVVRWGDPNSEFVGSPSGSEFDLTGYGVYEAPVARTAAQMGGEVDSAAAYVTLASVYQALLEGHPVEAWISADWRYHAPRPWLAFDGHWILYAGPAEHAVLLVGVDPSGVYVYNPISGVRWVSKPAFEGAFASYRNMAVIID